MASDTSVFFIFSSFLCDGADLLYWQNRAAAGLTPNPARISSEFDW
ncbi:hypothetical protein BUH_1513 [Burkholderia pseudomallei Pakistan 9]|nr:hypothetical protein BUH_1513 [Burkholderia pseudomallei Pakistan 9]